MSYELASRPPTGAGTLFYDGAPARYQELEPGEAGTVQTLAVMAELARVASRQPLLIQAAQHIVGQATGSPLRAALQIRAFLGRHLRFFPDPVDLELVVAPGLQLERIRSDGYVHGDCDDIATLGAALGLALHFPARFVILAFDPEGPWEHVYTELSTPDGWAELDTSREMQRVPSDFQPARVATFDV